MSYQVRFTVETKIESDNLYAKLCGLDRSKLPVFCIQTKNSETSHEDNVTDSFYNNKIMDTLILNDEFSVILNYMFPAALKFLHVVPLMKDCRVNLCNSSWGLIRTSHVC